MEVKIGREYSAKESIYGDENLTLSSGIEQSRHDANDPAADQRSSESRVSFHFSPRVQHTADPARGPDEQLMDHFAYNHREAPNDTTHCPVVFNIVGNKAVLIQKIQ